MLVFGYLSPFPIQSRASVHEMLQSTIWVGISTSGDSILKAPSQTCPQLSLQYDVRVCQVDSEY